MHSALQFIHQTFLLAFLFLAGPTGSLLAAEYEDFDLFSELATNFNLLTELATPPWAASKEMRLKEQEEANEFESFFQPIQNTVATNARLYGAASFSPPIMFNGGHQWFPLSPTSPRPTPTVPVATPTGKATLSNQELMKRREKGRQDATNHRRKVRTEILRRVPRLQQLTTQRSTLQATIQALEAERNYLRLEVLLSSDAPDAQNSR